MRKNIKNILWLGLSILAFMFFLIAVDSIGLIAQMPMSIGNDDGQLKFTLDYFVEVVNWANGQEPVAMRNVMALWISGIVFSTILVIFAACKLVLGFSKKEQLLSGFIGDIIMLSAIIFITILMIAGSSLTIDQAFATNGPGAGQPGPGGPNDTQMVPKFRVGTAVGHFVMLLVPALLIPIPMLSNKITMLKSQ